MREKPKRRWSQFSLRGLLVAMLLVAVLSAWLGPALLNYFSLKMQPTSDLDIPFDQTTFDTFLNGGFSPPYPDALCGQPSETPCKSIRAAHASRSATCSG